jgi:hypothetical protein
VWRLNVAGSHAVGSLRISAAIAAPCAIPPFQTILNQPTYR